MYGVIYEGNREGEMILVTPRSAAMALIVGVNLT